MKTEKKIVISLLLLPPVLAELLTGSTSPSEFFTPWGAVFLVLLYGCGVLLIREVRVRWRLQWSVIFLASAYGVLEEGVMIQSFFNIYHHDLGDLARYGIYGGIQWPWVIMLILFHATVSTLIPIAIVDLLFPEYRERAVLKTKGMVLSLIGLVSIVLFHIIFIIGKKLEPMYENYTPRPLLIGGAIASVFLLILLAYKYRNSRISSETGLLSPPAFGVCGFIFMALNLFIPSVLEDHNIHGAISILLQCILAGCTILFMVYQIYNRRITHSHLAHLIFGSLLFWILLTPVYELKGIRGISLVGIGVLILLIIWRKQGFKGRGI